MLQTKIITEFKGLNLSSTEQALGFEYGMEVNNMEFLQSGGMRTRGGYPTFSTTNQAAGINFLLWRQAAGRLLAIGPGEVNAYSSTTGVKSVPTGAPTWAATSVSPPAAVGDPTLKSWVYIASVNAGAGVQLRRYEDQPGPNVMGAAPTASKPMYVAVYPGQNRLAYAGFFAAADAPGGANGDPSTIFFSDEFAPDTVGATHFQRLDPGDGEYISAVLGWQNQLFVFKNTKVYVFYGVTPDDDGEPIFNFKSYPLPDPIPATAAPWAWVPAAAGPDGVYFIGTRGLWRTRGGAPTRVTTPVDAIFAKDTSLAGFRAPLTHGEVRLGFAGDRMHMAYVGNTSSDLVLTWNVAQNTWSSWNFNSGAFTSIPLVTKDGTFAAFTQFGTVGNIGKQNVALATDGNQGVTSYYYSGYDDLGNPGEKRIRFTDVYGQNTTTFDIRSKGRRGNPATEGTAGGPTIVLGATGDTERARFQTSTNGRVFRFVHGQVGGVQITTIERIEIRYSQGTMA